MLLCSTTTTCASAAKRRRRHSYKTGLGWKNCILAILIFSLLVTFASSADEGEGAEDGAVDGVSDEHVLKAFDSNHDGVLQQDELDKGINKLKGLFQKVTHKIEAKFEDEADGGGDITSGSGFWKAFTSALAMIIATEIGDKTFFIAAVLSMKHARGAVFFGAILALVIMTILSTAMGLVLPQFVSRKYTHIVGGILFIYFGVKLWLDSRSMEANQVSEELYEVEEELLNQKTKKGDQAYERTDSTASGASSVDEEEGGAAAGDANGAAGAAGAGAGAGRRRKRQKKQSWHAVAFQALSLTFLAEWGDRSQIATIALAAAKNPYGVTVGGCIGHSICTGLAVIGGRMLASSISEKTVCSFGGTIFLLFGIHAIFFET